MNIICRCVFLHFFAAAALYGADLNDEGIAKEAAAHASKLLSVDVDDEMGNRFFKLARALDADCDRVLLISSYMKRGQAPKPLPSTLSQNDLLKAMKTRAIYLLRKHFKNNVETGRLARLYLTFYDAIDNQDEDVLLGLVYLQSYGIQSPLAELLEEELDLKSIYNSRNRPSKATDTKVPAPDRSIAKEAARIASQELAKDPSNGQALTMLRYSTHINPDDTKALQLLMMLKRSMKIKPQKTKHTKEQLIGAIAKQGKVHAGNAEKDALSAHLALLNFRVLEALNPEDQNAMIGIMKLERLDIAGELDDLLATDMSMFASTQDSETPATVQTGSADDESKPGKDEKPGAIDGSKLKIECKSRKVARSDDSFYSRNKIRDLSVSGNIVNYLPHAAEGLTIETYIIGRPIKQKVFFIVAANKASGVTIPKRGELTVPTPSVRLSADRRYNYGYEYKAWLVIIKDKDGNILNKKSSQDGFAKGAEKIMTYKYRNYTSSYSGNTYYESYYTDTFDKDGNILSKAPGNYTGN